MTTEYAEFIEGKRFVAPAVGFDIADAELHPILFPHQRALTRWALAKGRAALFADAGLGKTFMQVEWARLVRERTGRPVLILAPLAVAHQTVREAATLGVELAYARRQEDAGSLTIANYEMLPRFDPDVFGAVVLDESSILKATEGVYRNRLIEMFDRTPYRLCCTATPAPNDIQEITNHSAFLGVMPRRDVLATFFLHASDDARASGWRLKGHARPAFWRWLSSWAMSLKKPSDLGYSDDGYDLPALRIEPHVVPVEWTPPGKLFFIGLKGIGERAAVRRDTAAARVAAAVELVEREPDEPWVIWCGLNAEQDAIAAALGDRAISVPGALKAEEKEARLGAWLAGERPVLVSKVSVCGFGLNMQRAARMVFVGLGDSYEQYYQAIRRCWRFGQTREVAAHVVLSEPEQAIFGNVLRKEREAEEMARELVRSVAAFERDELAHTSRDWSYAPARPMGLPAWMGA